MPPGMSLGSPTRTRLVFQELIHYGSNYAFEQIPVSPRLLLMMLAVVQDRN